MAIGTVNQFLLEIKKAAPKGAAGIVLRHDY